MFLGLVAISVSSDLQMAALGMLDKLWRIIGQIFASDRGDLTLTSSLGVMPCECPDELYISRNWIIVTEDRMIVSLFLWTKHRNVTNRRTDGEIQTVGQKCRSIGLHCEQCGRAVKTVKPWLSAVIVGELTSFLRVHKK